MTVTTVSPIALSDADQSRAIALAVIGISFFMAMPVVVGAWSTYAGFSAREAGLLAE